VGVDGVAVLGAGDEIDAPVVAGGVRLPGDGGGFFDDLGIGEGVVDQVGGDLFALGGEFGFACPVAVSVVGVFGLGLRTLRVAAALDFD